MGDAGQSPLRVGERIPRADMNYSFLIGGGVSAIALVLHVMLGRPHALGDPSSEEAPLHADAWLGRHIQSLFLLMLTLAFIHGTRHPQARDVVLWMSVLCLLISFLRLVLGAAAKAPWWNAREWGLCALAGLLGIAGLAL